MDRDQAESSGSRAVLEHPGHIALAGNRVWGWVTRVAHWIAQRSLEWSVHATIAICGIISLQLFYVVHIASVPPVEYSGGYVDPVVVRAGGTIYVGRTFTVHRREAVTITRHLKQGDCEKGCAIYDMDFTRTTFDPGIYSRVRALTIPDTVKPGKYDLVFHVQWENYAGKSYSVPVPTLSVEVR